MNRRDLVLAALSPAAGKPFSPVRVQKLFFLIDRNIAVKVGGPHFAFEPYDYGPFDSSVYHELDALSRDGFVAIDEGTGRYRNYRLTDAGQAKGEELFHGLDADTKDYLGRAVTFVRSLRFADLVASIYKAYPEMKTNSVFKG